MKHKFKQGDPVQWRGDYRVYEVVDFKGERVVVGEPNGDVFYERPDMLTLFPEPYVYDGYKRPIRVGQLVQMAPGDNFEPAGFEGARRAKQIDGDRVLCGSSGWYLALRLQGLRPEDVYWPPAERES